MPQKRAGMGQANVSASVTAERLRIRKRMAEGDTRPLSAAERVVNNPQAPRESQVAAAAALRQSRKIRRIKDSPGYNLEVPVHPEPGDGKLNPKCIAMEFDSTASPVKPSVR